MRRKIRIRGNADGRPEHRTRTPPVLHACHWHGTDLMQAITQQVLLRELILWSIPSSGTNSLTGFGAAKLFVRVQRRLGIQIGFCARTGFAEAIARGSAPVLAVPTCWILLELSGSLP